MLRLSVQNTLRLKIAQWSPEKQEQFLQIFRKKFQRGSSEDRLIALVVMRMRGEEQLLENFLHASNLTSVASWSAGDAAFGWSWEALRAESIPGSALSTNPSQGALLSASLVPRSGLHKHMGNTP